MKHFNRKILTLILFSVVAIDGFGYSFEVGGIYYNKVFNKEVRVTYKDESYNSYSGNIKILPTVNYGGIDYNVTGIDSHAFYNCTGLTSIEIPTSVSYIGSRAFNGCTGLTSVEIPSSVRSFDTFPFENCSNLVKVTINSDYIVSTNSNSSLSKYFGSQVEAYILGEAVTKIGSSAFKSCSNMKSIDISKNITRIEENAFYECTGLTTIDLPESLITIGNYAFFNCRNLKRLKIRQNVTSIGDYAFSNCTNITDITLPYNLTSIGNEAFRGCTTIKSVKIPQKVSNIGAGVFAFCDDLTSITVDSNNGIYNDGNGNNCIIHTNTNKLIAGCANTSIPSSVTSIGSEAFLGCWGLTSVSIPNSVQNIENNAFSSCNNLDTIIINSNNMFTKNVVFSSIFGEQVKKYIIGDAISYIYVNAFLGSNSLETIELPDFIQYIQENSIPSECNCYVKKGSRTLLSLWSSGFSNNIDKETDEKIMPTVIKNKDITQTTITSSIDNYCDGYAYFINETSVKKGEDVKITDLLPETEYDMVLYVSLDGYKYAISTQQLRTADITPVVEKVYSDVTSMNLRYSYTKGDAKVTKQTVRINGEETDDAKYNTISFSQLDPGTSYLVEYLLEVTSDSGETKTYSFSDYFSTDNVVFKSASPRVVSEGNVIIVAQSNLSDDEENVGFEWRRTDWPDYIASSTGTAYLYNGLMEGYIRNLNISYYWRYRPYYISYSGNTYYGDWVGVDPTNTSYFDPTVHTYSKNNVRGNTAEVRGLALNGTEKMTAQGFKYWQNDAKAKDRGEVGTFFNESEESTENIGQGEESKNSPRHINAVPKTAKTVEASGYVMTADITDLAYETTYSYVAFVTTSEGDTFYGEVQTFTTESDPNGNKYDVNRDGSVDISDIVAVINIIAGTSSNFQGDVNGDNNTDISDIVAIINNIATK